MNLQPHAPGFPYPSLKLSVPQLLAIHHTVVSAGCHYDLGAKVVPITSPPGTFHAVDCSGYVRFLIHALSGGDFPDGSANQHDAVQAAGFKRSDHPGTVATPELVCDLRDGVVRIAFLPVQKDGHGHVALFVDGQSIESHGGVGPDRRAVAECHSWLPVCSVYVLTVPGANG